MKERIKKAAAVYLAAAAVGIALAVIFTVTGRAVPCVFHLLTGMKCGGCGNTTAVLSLLKLDFAGALRANYFMPLEFGYIAFALFCYTRDYIKKGSKNLLPKPEWINWVFLVLLIVWSAGRNIIGV